MKLVVLGAGESGVGAALLGKAKGFEVFVSDRSKIKQDYKNVLLNNSIDWEEGVHSENKIFKAETVVKSPGIPSSVKLIQDLIARNIEVISEIEFASRFTSAVLVGITGSNGKTTTSTLTYELLKNDLSVGLAGNIGDSFAKSVSEKDLENYVIEISSFQLDDIKSFNPHIAVITNITPDHLDRYDYDFQKYIQSKFRIVENQTNQDYLIYDADDDVLVDYINNNKMNSRLIPFSLEQQFSEGVYLKENSIVVNINNREISMALEELAINGKHNVKNTMAASAVAHLLKIRKQTIRQCLENFQGVEHRLEDVFTINKVRYINDSKATNVNATYYALESMKNPTVWIVGGVDKGNDYEELFRFVNEKVKAIICLGVDNKKLLNTFDGMTDCIVEASSMDEAVDMAYRLSVAGDNVLLSPACASFDLFENYEDRGLKFKQAVRRL